MTPTIFRERGYRFFFFSREESRMHVHVVSGDGEAKFWLEPVLQLEKSYHYNQRQIREIQSLIEERHLELIDAWKSCFGG
ncbi:protein of unknown function [Ectothiorhodosinus mongolicus]|uniref:DUF4160 domain-containing protein n=1 Tax=Ectothiorhodosinus mongolicus TaxID=233100 RepID=A0A1R3VMW1_9GAMM|nr:DUF4160 domain-containing protein [Ectothiorhodosinus mongolicus]SIT65918.1 protein of unknown function [Ectothiorhodosinus mongolicus]